jgi:hypothetical protein
VRGARADDGVEPAACVVGRELGARAVAEGSEHEVADDLLLGAGRDGERLRAAARVRNRARHAARRLHRGEVAAGVVAVGDRVARAVILI